MTRTRSAGTAVTGDCRAQLSQLFDYLDGELSPARCKAIERHLASCHCCEALAFDLRRAMALCRVAGSPRMPAGVQRRARAAARRLLTQAD